MKNTKENTNLNEKEELIKLFKKVAYQIELPKKTPIYSNK